MSWWLAFLVSLIGASGGVAGGWLSGRIASAATLQAVREERRAREARDYLAALGAHQQMCALAIAFATEVPPAAEPSHARVFSGLSDKLFEGVAKRLFSDRERSLIGKTFHPSLALTYWTEKPAFAYTLRLDGSTRWDESVARRVDAFLESSARVRSLAPPADLDTLRRVEEFIISTVRKPPPEQDAFTNWEPLRLELQRVAEKAYARVNELPTSPSDSASGVG